MQKVREFTFNCWVKGQFAKNAVKDKVQHIREEIMSEDGGFEGIIIAVLFIIIIVALAIIFRDKIGEWLNTLFGKAETDISNFDGKPTTT